MTVTTTLDRQYLACNGVNQVFPFNVKFFNNSQIAVYKIANDTNYTTTPLVLGVDYSLSGAGTPTGGTVTTTSIIPDGYQLLIRRALVPVQSTSIRNQSRFFPHIHEDTFDFLTMLAQQALATVNNALQVDTSGFQWDALNKRIKNVADPVNDQDAVNKRSMLSALSRTIRVPAGESPVGELGNAASRAGGLLGFDGAGAPTIIAPGGGTAVALALSLANAVNMDLGVSMIGGANRVVPTIAALRTVSKTKNPIVFVEGYYTPGDSGGGFYYLSETGVENGGTVIVGADGGKWRLVRDHNLHVKQFGCVGDGITDDTARLQACFTAIEEWLPNQGGNIHFGNGQFLVSATLNLGANVRLIGQNRITTRILRFGNYGNTINVGNASIGAQAFHCINIDFFHGGIFNGNEGDTITGNKMDHAHLYIRGGNGVMILGCQFYRGRYNIRFGGGAWVYIHDSMFYGVFADDYVGLQEGYASITCEYDALYGHPVEWFVHGNNFSGAKRARTGFPIVSADGTYNTTAPDGFTYVMAAAVFVDIQALESAVFSGNYFGGANRIGINFPGVTRPDTTVFNPFNIRITENMFDPCLTAQIGFTCSIANGYSHSIVIANNHLVGDRNGKSAILMARNNTSMTPAAYDVVISGNNIYGHFGAPIIADGVYGCQIVGNIIKDWNKLAAATTDRSFVSGVCIRGATKNLMVTGNGLGGNYLYTAGHHCLYSVYIEAGPTNIVNTGNLNNGNTNWTAQSYPA